METLVIVAHHRNQYDSRIKIHGSVPLGSFGSTSSKTFKAINCRTFQSGADLLPTPQKPCNTPASKPTFYPLSPETPSVNSKSFARSSVVSIPAMLKPEFIEVDKPRTFIEDFPFSELWAGPAYSNSPPPSSLPIPKFSLRIKRTVSLELSSSPYDIDLHPLAKSEPSSPTWEWRQHLSSNLFGDENGLATRDLCRILNLDMTDD